MGRGTAGFVVPRPNLAARRSPGPVCGMSPEHFGVFHARQLRFEPDATLLDAAGEAGMGEPLAAALQKLNHLRRRALK